MCPQVFEADELQGVDVGGFEDDGRSLNGIECLRPAGDAEAPLIARIQAWKVVFRDGGGKVVAALPAEGEKGVCHHRADRVQAFVIRSGAAVAVTIKAGDGPVAAGLQWGSEDVGGHREGEVSNQ